MFKFIRELFEDNSKDVTSIKMNRWLDKNNKYAIYLLTDSKVNRTAKYFDSMGVHVFDASCNLTDIGNKFIMDIEPSILLLIDTGRGLFSNVKAQEALIDIIGAGDLSMNKAVIVFYTDSSIKIDALRNISNFESVKWLKYKGTADVIAKLLSAGIETEESNKEYEDYNDELEFKVVLDDEEKQKEMIETELMTCLFGRRMNRVNNARTEIDNVLGKEYDEKTMIKAFEVKI